MAASASELLRVRDGVHAERWGVIQDEATRVLQERACPCFGEKFANQLDHNSVAASAD